VDASFAVHPDMKIHTSGAMSLGKGVVYGTSTRQKLNTKSSTEAELVGVNDVMPTNLVDLVLHGGTGLRCQGLNNQPGQSERNLVGEKWVCFKW
jgi:hypothetical protein